MTDLKPVLLSLLSSLPASVSAGYPLEELPLPIVTVALENSSVHAQADGEPYLEEQIYSLHFLAASPAEIDALSPRADALLSSLGLRRQSCREGFDEIARAYTREMTYRALVRGDTVYSS